MEYVTRKRFYVWYFDSHKHLNFTVVELYMAQGTEKQIMQRITIC